MSENNNNHVDEQIEAYLDDQLTAAERIAFDAHIADCETCRALLDESRQTRAELQSLFASAQLSESFEDRLIEGFRMGTARRLHWIQPSVRRAAFAAAAAVLLVGAGITVSQSLDVSERKLLAMNATERSIQDSFFLTAKTQDLGNAVFNVPGARDQSVAPIRGGTNFGRNSFGEKSESKRLAGELSTGLDAKVDSVRRSEDRAAGVAGGRPYLAAREPNSYGPIVALKDGASPRRDVLGLPAITEKESLNQPSLKIIQESGAQFRSKADAASAQVAEYQAQSQKGMDVVTQTGVQKLNEAQDENKKFTSQLQKSESITGKQLADGINLNFVDRETLAGAKPEWRSGEQLADQSVALPKPQEENAQHGSKPIPEPEGLPTTQSTIMGRKIIRNANMQFEVERFDDALLRITKLATEQGGFVSGTDSDKLPNGKMRGTITLRVPPEHLENLVLELRGIGDLKGQKISAEDITKHYTDLESSLRAAHAMQDRLLEIIKTGKGQIKDLLEAEKQLGVWREKSEQIEGEKRYLDNLVGLSTLTIELAERDIRQAAVATESEQVAMSLETEAVDKAYAKAREVIETAKGRILQSEMKQLDAGQFGATIRAAIPPDVAEQVIAGLRQLNGRIAHFSRESQRKTQEGDAPATAANSVRHDDTIIAIQIYNLANIAPRRTTNIVIAMNDVEKAYQKLLADIQSAGGQVQTSSLTRPDANQQTGEIQVQLPTDKSDALELTASNLGEMLRHDSTENPDGANVTDAKRGYHFTIVSATSIAARETRQMTLVATTVGSALETIRQAVADAGGRITQSELNDQGADGQNGVLSFDLPRANLQTVTAAIDKSAVLLSQSATRSPDTQNTIDSKLRFSLTINSAQKLAPRQTVTLGSEVTDVSAAVADLTTAVDAAGGRRVDSGGVSQDHTTTTAEVVVELPADHLPAIMQQIEQRGRILTKHVAFDVNAPQGALSRARIQVTFADSAKNLGGQESGWDAMRRGLETSAAGLRWSLQMLVIGACFVAPWAVVIWIGWKLLRRKPRKAISAQAA